MLDTPAWITENFGENVYTITEILQADEGSSGRERARQTSQQPGEVLRGTEDT